MKFSKILKNFYFIFSLIFILLNYNSSKAQQKNQNKIIIEDNFGNGRLLSPPTGIEQEKIRLIPPKSVLE